jgi:hypothetical protein
VRCITGGNGPNVVPVVTHVSCNGANNGSICLTNTTGVVNPCLKYKIGATCTSIFGTGTTNPCFNNLPAGNYCVKITDTCTGCDTCICVTISQPNPLIATATATTVCPCNSSITVVVAGGTPCGAVGAYTYQMLPAGVPQASPTFNNLCAGCYTIRVTDCNGCTTNVVQCVGPCGGNPIVVNLKTYIQGYYTGSGMMAPVLLNQGVSSSPNQTDNIQVQLRSMLPPYGVVSSTTSMLNTNGQTTCTFNGANPGMYYLVVRHRNGLETWSAGPIPLSATTATTYDFSVSASQAYGNNMVEVDPGVWAIYSGDINLDENIDLGDLNLFENDATNFAFGYLATDINGDGTVDLLDAPVLDNNIASFIFSIHP